MSNDKHVELYGTLGNHYSELRETLVVEGLASIIDKYPFDQLKACVLSNPSYLVDELKNAINYCNDGSSFKSKTTGFYGGEHKTVTEEREPELFDLLRLRKIEMRDLLLKYRVIDSVYSHTFALQVNPEFIPPCLLRKLVNAVRYLNGNYVTATCSNCDKAEDASKECTVCRMHNSLHECITCHKWFTESR